jgi:hypothetical protein
LTFFKSLILVNYNVYYKTKQIILYE